MGEGHARLARVMLVDDDPDIHDLVRVALGRAGTEVHVCEVGLQAVAEARRFRPDVILLDYMMPDIDGPRVLETLRSTSDLNAIPVVFLTSLGGKRDAAAIRAMGADAVLPKPFDPFRLRESLERILGQVHD